MTIRPAPTGIVAIGIAVAVAAIQQASGQPGDTQPAAIHASNAIEAPAAPPAAPQLISRPGSLLPDDPCQRVAVKALRGDFGQLDRWQHDAYTWIIARNVTCCGKAKVTSYGPWEPVEMWGGGDFACGSKVHLRGCASNPEIPFGTLIWTPYGLRYVTDRGGWVKVGYARVFGRMKRVTSRSEIANLDYYTKREWDTLRNAPYAVVKRNCAPSAWRE